MSGRPLKYNNCLDLDMDCELYFEHCEEEKEHPTVSGLAVFLGMDRTSISNYSKRDEFFDTIKKARARVEAHLEQCLYNGQVAGVIFNLKNNFYWKDQQELKQQSEITGKDGNPIEQKWQIEFVDADAASKKN